MSAIAPGALEALAHLRADAGDAIAWPNEQLDILGEAGVLADVIPREFGGTELPGHTLVSRYEAIASACVETAFVLTQRNGACQRIAAADNEALKRRTLPELARGERYATVGISHLTTSRQHLGRPAVVARPDGDGWLLQGEAPWVSGAMHADWIVTGAVTTDGQQILCLVDTSSAAVEVEASIELMAFTSSDTATVGLHNVRVGPQDLLAGPSPRVLHEVKVGGTGSLTTSALAIGAARASILGIRAQAERRPELEPTATALFREHRSLHERLVAAAHGRGDGPGESQRLRAGANSLVVRAATAWMAVAKGAGYVAGHPADRAVREAMFFLVWSCPRSVVLDGLGELSARRDRFR